MILLAKQKYIDVENKYGSQEGKGEGGGMN